MSQEIYIKAKNSDYLHEIVQKKDWKALIELASARDAFSDLIFEFFSNDDSKQVLKEMSEEQILMLIDTAPLAVSNNILNRMESFCDTDSKFTDIAVKLMKGVFTHGGDLLLSSVVKCLPINILRIILDSRIPLTEFHFSISHQEFFMHIISTLSPDSKKNYSYKSLKERDCTNGVFTYISDEMGSFPLGRREVYKEVINALRESFSYVESNDNLDYKLPFIRDIIINPFMELINRGLRDPVLDYRNDKEITSLIKSIFDEYYHSKYYLSCAQLPILADSGNSGILIDSNLLEECKVISPNYYYKVFKKAVEENKDNFIDSITRVFFTNCRTMHFIRELNDGIYDKLYNATIDMTVRELIERKQSTNFESCCNLLKYNYLQSFSNSYNPRFDECISYIKSVISKIFDKSQTLNVDATSYPEICCYLLNKLNGNSVPLPIERNLGIDACFLIRSLTSNSHTALDLLDADMRNNLVLGVIRHPTDNTKFSHIITSNNPTTLVNFICNLHSVQDIKLILPESKRNSIDKYGFREGRSSFNPKESCQMNLVEIFLHTLRFWENNDKSLFRDGYTSYYQFVRKILTESILTKDIELKKAAINVYYRFSELVSLIKNAKFVNTRIQIASTTFLSPIAVIVGSELDKDFVEKYATKFIQPFNAQSYQSILTEVISNSHLDMNYYDDEEEIDNDVDNLFKQINIDRQMATATKLLLSFIKQNPVKNFNIGYNCGYQDDFFLSDKRVLFNIKKKFDLLNPKILDVCNPFKTEYPISMDYNNPHLYPVILRAPQFKMSGLVYQELCQFVSDEFKEYSPKMFKSNLTKSLIKIQKLIKDLGNGAFDLFNHTFYLDPPTLDTNRKRYDIQTRTNCEVLYSKAFFEFLNEINKNQNSIYNDESYEIVKNAFIAQFLNEEDYLQQKNKPPPKFDGFTISLFFRAHRYSNNIFNTKTFSEGIKKFKLSTYQDVNNLNQNLINAIERNYNNSKLLDDHPIDDVFKPDSSTHRSRELSESARTQFYGKNVHKCFTKIIDALNLCKAETFSNEFNSLEKLQTFSEIKNYGSGSNSYTMLTSLLDLLINDFVSTSINMTKTYKNRICTYNDIYRFMSIVAQIASPNIGQLKNLQKLCELNERTIAQKVPNRNTELFDYIFRNGKIDQILLCMNSPLFSINSDVFYNYLLSESGLLNAKQIVNTLINEVSNGKQVLDDFLVSLARCSIHPRFVGFPAPQSSLEFLKKITNKSIYAKRAACANAVYYAIMSHISAQPIPLKDIIEIIESAHKKSPDEITAFFCILICRDASLRKIGSLPALNDLMSEYAMPYHYIIDQNFGLNIPKEIGDLYYNCIEKVILSGLKSKKSHIYELTVTVLNEINVGPEIHQIISPFIEKGLKEIEPSDDNEAFLTYATSFTMKNPEFKGCFDSYCEALSKIQKHSLAILKANFHLNKDSPYPEPFKKLENSYSTITNTIEKPFNEFKEENEMIPASQFCRKLLPVLRKNRPAVARDVFLKLEAYASIFGDPLIEDMVKLYKQDKKEESLSKFIGIVTHHEELVLNLPQSIRTIYHHLNSSFTKKHSIELSENLSDSQGKLPISMQRAYQLADLIAPDVLSHMPEEKDVEGGKEDDLVQVLANLGIFCKKRAVATYGGVAAGSFIQHKFAREMDSVASTSGMYQDAGLGAARTSAAYSASSAAPRMMKFKKFSAPSGGAVASAAAVADTCAPIHPPAMAEPECCEMKINRGFKRLAKQSMMSNEIEIERARRNEEEIICNDECTCDAIEEPAAAADVDEDVLDDDDDVIEEAEQTEDNEIGGGEEGSNEDGGENELNQDQINDAFDLFF